MNYPADGNRIGTRLTDLWKRAGDLVRDMGALLRERGLNYSDEEIGGRGSIRLYVATRQAGRGEAGIGHKVSALPHDAINTSVQIPNVHRTSR